MPYRQEWADAVRAVVADRTYREVAQRVGVSKSYISDWLQGLVPSYELVVKFATGMDVPKEPLLQAAGYAIETGEQRFYRGLRELTEKYGLLSVPSEWIQQGVETLTIEQAEQYLAAIERNIDALQPDPKPVEARTGGD